jgi:hypothetical protein
MNNFADLIKDLLRSQTTFRFLILIFFIFIIFSPLSWLPKDFNEFLKSFKDKLLENTYLMFAISVVCLSFLGRFLENIGISTLIGNWIYLVQKEIGVSYSKSREGDAKIEITENGKKIKIKTGKMVRELFKKDKFFQKFIACRHYMGINIIFIQDEFYYFNPFYIKDDNLHGKKWLKLFETKERNENFSQIMDELLFIHVYSFRMEEIFDKEINVKLLINEKQNFIGNFGGNFPLEEFENIGSYIVFYKYNYNETLLKIVRDNLIQYAKPELSYLENLKEGKKHKKLLKKKSWRFAWRRGSPLARSTRKIFHL